MAQSDLAPLDDLLSPQLNWLFQRPQRLGKPSGWWGHVPFAFWVIEAIRPRLLVELGSHHGVSYAAFCEAVSLAKLDCRCFAIDNWQGDAHAGHFDETVYHDLLDFNRSHYGAFSELIRADFADALRHFADGSIDLLHIDGFHTYEAVLRDYQQWQPKLSERAIVLFHDTNVRRDDFGVHRLFAELSQSYPHFEFLHGNGLGLIAHGKQIPEAIDDLCAQAGNHQCASLRERFSYIGARWEGHANEQEMKQSFALQVAALETERLKAGQQRADAEMRVTELERELQMACNNLRQAETVLATQKNYAQYEITELRAQLQTLKQTQHEVTELRQQLQLSEERLLNLKEENAALSQAMTAAATELASSKAQGEVQTRRLAQDLLACKQVTYRPGLMRRLKLLLRRGHAQRNPVADVVRRSVLFDSEWYLRTYSDVAHAAIEPAFHYAAHGGSEGRDPGPWFSTSEYLRYNPDVASAGINALFHYELHGRTEGRAFPLKPLQATPPAREDLKALFRKHSLERLEAFLSEGKSLQLPTSEQPLLSIIIILYNQAELTFSCLESLTKTIDVAAEVLIIDNASSDRTAELLTRVPGCRVLPQPTNLHFLRAANLGAAEASGRYLLFLNNDTLVKPGSIKAALEAFEEHDKVGAVGGKIVLLDGSLQEAGSIVWSDGSCLGYGRGRDPQDAEFQFRREVDYCSGAFLMVPRALFEQLGGFDQAFAPAYYEEADLCMRLRQAGYATLYEPRAEILHIEYGSATDTQAATQLMTANHGIFREHHDQVLATHHLPNSSPALLARMRPAPRGRILLIDDQVPIPSWGSGYPRARELLVNLRNQGAFVTLYPTASSNIDFAEAYATLPRNVEIAAAQGPAGIASFLRSRRDYYDALIISRPHNMQILFDELVREPDLLGRTRLIYDAEAICAQRDALKASVLGTSEQPADMAAELLLAKPAQTILAVNRGEAEHFSQNGFQDVRVLGHCIKLQPTAETYTERQNLLFVGRLSEDDSPNADSILWFVREVMPRLDCLLGSHYRLDVVGACSANLRRELQSKRVHFHGRVEDIRDFYASARLFIAPTRFAAGIPLKIYEAAAHGLPVVASNLLVAQLGWSDGNELLAAESADGFAQACARLYSEPALWALVREQALLRTEQDCSSQRFSNSVRQLLGDALPPGSNTRQDYTTKISEVWSQPAAQRAEDMGMNWMEHPLVLARLNRKLSGDPDQACYLYLRKYLQQQGWKFPVKRAASLGCGFGPLERALAIENFAERIDGYDLATGAITEARRLAAEKNLKGLHYHVADIERLDLPEAEFDLIFAFSCVHHVDDLDGLFRQVRRALRPGGVFFMHEYVGPDRFQWTDDQLEHINTFIADLPPGYNCLPNGQSRGMVRRPSIEEVTAWDPSEAIRSSQIAETLQRHFSTLQQHELGGALLHIGLSGIAQNFSANEPADVALMESFFALEDRLMAEGKIASDFAIFTAIKV